jgi:hypothetical protein
MAALCVEPTPAGTKPATPEPVLATELLPIATPPTAVAFESQPSAVAFMALAVALSPSAVLPCLSASALEHCRYRAWVQSPPATAFQPIAVPWLLGVLAL